MGHLIVEEAQHVGQVAYIRGIQRGRGRLIAMLTDIAPTYDEEAALLDDGYAVIAGVDEVGRGSLAGPVVAGSGGLALVLQRGVD